MVYRGGGGIPSYLRVKKLLEKMAEWSKAADCKSVSLSRVGSNPTFFIMLKYSHSYNLFLSDSRLLSKNASRGSLKNVFRLVSRRRHLAERGIQPDGGRVLKPYSFYQLNPMAFLFKALILGPKLTHKELGFGNVAKLRLIITFRQKTLFVNL